MGNKAKEFDKMAREVFAPAYPVVAKQILEKTKVSQGSCLDIGCGSGYLGLAIALASDLNIYSMDNDPEMLKLLQQNLVDLQLESRVKPLLGDVHKISIETDSIHLAVSRGSMFFWENPVQAFNEIYRVLAPGGMACIGGGFGTLKIKQQIDQTMLQRNPNWLEHLRKNIGPEAPKKWRQILSKTNIPKFNIEHSPTGMWIVFRK